MPSSTIYEDDAHIAILDLFPVTPGHAMLIPKEHHINIFDASEEDCTCVYPKLIKVARALRHATECKGLNLIQNNEEAAGQIVFHSHIHLIPRYGDENLRLAAQGKRQATPEELAEMAEKIKASFEQI